MGEKIKCRQGVRTVMSEYIQELREEQKKNVLRRREFIKQYAQWVKKTPNSVWSKAQNKLMR